MNYRVTRNVGYDYDRKVKVRGGKGPSPQPSPQLDEEQLEADRQQILKELPHTD